MSHCTSQEAPEGECPWTPGTDGEEGEVFLTGNSLALFLGYSTRGEEIVRLQIMTPGAGLHLMSPDLGLVGERHGQPELVTVPWPEMLSIWYTWCWGG